MTDLRVRPAGPGPDPLVDRALWRVRLELLSRSLETNWKLFSASPIGVVGLVIIGAFGLMAVMQPWLLQGFSVFRITVITAAWALLSWVSYRALQTPAGMTAIVGIVLFGVASWFLIGGDASLNRVAAVAATYGVVMYGISRMIHRVSGLSKTAAAAVALGVGGLLAWSAFVTMDAWDAGTYHPVVGVELNPPVLIRTVVPEVTNPETEISLRDALLSDPEAMIGSEIELRLQPAPPDRRHLLGTDPLGRDVLSQLMFGARAAFLLGLVTALVTVVIATTVGAVAAFFGGWIDSFFMRLADLLLMLPAIAIFIVMSSILDFRLWHLAVFLGLLTGFGGIAIILKSQALAVKVKPFIDAARVAGGSRLRIIFTHIVPNVVPLAFLYMMFSVTTAIQTEATLSFLGLMNIDMSWGIMINIAQSQGYLLRGVDFWWLLYPAGLSVTLLAAAFFLVGRGMDQVVNPRLRRR